MTDRKPLVFACAGCSFAARLSWDLAKELDRRGLAEMSCLAGVAAGKRVFLRQLRGREVWVIDGCPIECGLGVFGLSGLPVDQHIRLAEMGFTKHTEPEGGVDMDALVDRVIDEVIA